MILYKFASFSTIKHFIQRTGQGFQQEFSTSVLKSWQIPNKQRLLILSFPVFPHARVLKTRKFHCKKAMKKTFCPCLNGEIKNFFRVFSRKNYTFRLYMYLHVIKRHFRYIFSSHTVFSSIYFKVQKTKAFPIGTAGLFQWKRSASCPGVVSLRGNTILYPLLLLYAYKERTVRISRGKIFLLLFCDFFLHSMDI